MPTSIYEISLTAFTNITSTNGVSNSCSLLDKLCENDFLDERSPWKFTACKKFCHKCHKLNLLHFCIWCKALGWVQLQKTCFFCLFAFLPLHDMTSFLLGSFPWIPFYFLLCQSRQNECIFPWKTSCQRTQFSIATLAPKYHFHGGQIKFNYFTDYSRTFHAKISFHQFLISEINSHVRNAFLHNFTKHTSSFW